MADGCGDRGQRCCAERCADLAAGVDHAADDALLGRRNPGGGNHHGAERGTSRTEPDKHHSGQQERTVMPAGGELGEQRKPARGEGPGEHEHAPDAEPARQPGPEGARRKPDDPVRSYGKPGG